MTQILRNRGCQVGDKTIDQDLLLTVHLPTNVTSSRATAIIILFLLLFFIPQVVKIPRLKTKKPQSKCRMARGLAGQLAECRANARS